MVQLKVLILGTSAAETFQLEGEMQNSGGLAAFRYVRLDQACAQVPDWENWDLVIARYNDQNSGLLLPLLAPILRGASPRVIFLVDLFEPVLVHRLLDVGAWRVFPADGFETLLPDCLQNLSLPVDLPAQPIKNDGKVVEERPSERKSSFLERMVSEGQGIARVFMNSPIGISVNRLRDGKCVDCNESLARLLGYSREELIGRISLELGLPLEPVGSLNEGVEIVKQSELPVGKIFTRTRQVRYIHLYLDRIFWKGEECSLALVQDVTGEEEAYEKIKRLNLELEKTVQVRTGALNAANLELAAEIGRRKYLEDFSGQLSQTLRETTDIVAIIASDGHVQFMNKAGRTLFGLAEDAPVTHLDLLFPYTAEMRRRFNEEIQPVLKKKGTWRGETVFQLPDGHIIPISLVLVCKKNDGGFVMYYAMIARDISDLKRAEQELRQSRERYRTLAEAAHDFIFMVSKDGLMEYANTYACRALGHNPQAVEGIPAGQFFPKNFAFDHLQMFYQVQVINHAVYTEGPFFYGEDEYWLGTWLVPIHNQKGGLVSILGISRDITEQKKTDEALQNALQNERNLAEIRSNFFSMTSHQFRTPLSTILLSAELLQRYGMKWDETKRGEQLRRILDAAQRLNAMLEEILILGRVESGRYLCIPKDFDLIVFINQVINEMATNDNGKHVFAFNHDVDELPVFLDQEVFRRVLDNLLSNAIKYSPAGSQVTISIKIEDLFFLMEVSDQGIGIPEKDLKYLFQPFQRGSNSAEYPGTGIGLTIIQKSAELMNGTVSVSSREGAGTTFMVRFPARLVSTTSPVSFNL
jgi:PAS domain S-box-containing protein